MLTVNVVNSSGEQTLFSALSVRADGSNVSILLPRGEGGDPHSDYLAQDSLVYVMNDTGATVARYDYRNCAAGPAKQFAAVGASARAGL